MKYNNYRQKHRKHAPDDAPHSRGRPPDHQQIEQGAWNAPYNPLADANWGPKPQCRAQARDNKTTTAH